MSCEFCRTDDSLQKGNNLLIFDENISKEGYVYILKSGKLVVDNDYARSQIEINYCPICGRQLNKG